MKHFYKLLLVTFLTPLFSYAQTNYKPGYVVTLKGDTLHGFIDYRGWDTNPNSISFKQTAADVKIQKLSTAEIDFFSIDNLESYKKYTLKISMDQTDLNHINNGRDSSFKTADVFLKILQKGKKLNLFEYSDDIKSRLYITESSADQPYELDYKIYNNSNSESASGKTVTESTYMRQLYAIALKDGALTDALQVDIERSAYESSDILKIVSKINGMSESESADHSHLNLVGGIGVNITHSAPTTSFNEGAKPYTSFLPMISFGVDLPANPNSGKLVFRFDLSVAPGHYTTTYDNKAYPYVNVTYAYSLTAISLNPQVIYNLYNADNFKFYIGAGMALTKYISMGEKYKDKNGNDVPTAANPADFVSIGVPLILKTGVRFNKKYGIFANYVTGGPVSNDYIFRLNYSSIQFGVNYYF